MFLKRNIVLNFYATIGWNTITIRRIYFISGNMIRDTYGGARRRRSGVFMCVFGLGTMLLLFDLIGN